MSTTVHVKNIAPSTSEKEVQDFFSFCGKISSISVTPTSSGPDAPKSATVSFEKEAAAKTALLLDNTKLGQSTVEVTSAASLDDLGATSKDGEDEEIRQEDKPRSRIIAEYLAHGYVIGDKAIERAIALDNQHGVSNRFASALKTFDSKYKATDKAKGVDAKFGVSDKAFNAWGGLNSYFEKALGTPTGQKLRTFYETGNKQVIDVHNEARHLANLKSGKTGEASAAPNVDAEASSAPKVDVESSELHYVAPGKTACNCGGAEGVCACKAGECTCGSCAKNTDVKA